MKRCITILCLAFLAIAANAQTLIYKGNVDYNIIDQFNPIPAEYTIGGKNYLEWLEYDTEYFYNKDVTDYVTENTITVYDAEMNSVKRIYVPYKTIDGLGGDRRSAERINVFGSDSGEDNLFVASQTLFNDDEDFEYIRLESTSSNDAVAGFSIVSSNGTVLSYTAFSESNDVNAVNFYAYHADTHNLLIVELEADSYGSAVYVYKIDKSTSSVKQAFQTVKATPVVEADDGDVRVSGCVKGDRINVYNIDGSLVKTVKAAGSNAVISGLMLNNTYLVKVGGTSAKITL